MLPWQRGSNNREEKMPTKIAPAEAVPPHPFTLIDTPSGRLVDGCVALFALNGQTTEISLRTHKPYVSAQGQLADGLAGGQYDVSVRQPDGNVIAIGPFSVPGSSTTPSTPAVDPTSGPTLSPFVITDPAGRMQSGDVCLFYPEGTDPQLGIAASIDISADGTKLTGTVPGSLDAGPYFITVRPSTTQDPRFGDLAFAVTL